MPVTVLAIPTPAVASMVNKEELLTLAKERCQAIKQVLISQYQINNKQIAIAPHQTIIARQNSGKNGRRVDFSFSTIKH